MKLTPELHVLVLVAIVTALMWLPYMLARIFTRGLVKTMANPDPSFKPDPAWAERARRAHANAVENLAVFAPLAIVAATIGVSTPTTVMAANIYLWARIAHFVVYTLGIPVLRSLAFAAGFAATLAMAGAILGAT
ncbi:MAPEG family protein [Luteibacter yeojuensis]|uniref:MAPEG family protein n=1 Tax=Luteibacter yeojuensis TaxID=345309 RepID=A0A7X5QWP0_9GAMM|nr:MAPEG family protein [Luteibacter yeojuensis]NID16709.1 MAPEG family protein [Luteibacter yeojuensis]